MQGSRVASGDPRLQARGRTFGARVGAGPVAGIEALDRVRDGPGRRRYARHDVAPRGRARAGRRPARRRSGLRSATCQKSGSTANRGAVIAACGSSPSYAHARQDLEVRLRLRRARPSLPNTSHGRPSRSASAGISVCIGILPRTEPVRMRLVEAERGATVLEVDPPLVDAQPAPAPEKFDLDQAHEQSVAIGGAQVDRAAVRARIRVRQRRARAGRCASRRRAIQSSASIALAGDRHRVRITDVVVAVDERALHRLDQQVLAVGAVGSEIEAVGDAQRLQRGDALGRRRQLRDLEVARTERAADRPTRPCARRGRRRP